MEEGRRQTLLPHRRTRGPCTRRFFADGQCVSPLGGQPDPPPAAAAAVNITKTVRLVIAEPDTCAPEVERAHQEGQRVVTPAEAWDVLRAASGQSEASLFADSGSQEAAARMNPRCQGFGRGAEVVAELLASA